MGNSRINLKTIEKIKNQLEKRGVMLDIETQMLPARLITPLIER